MSGIVGIIANTTGRFSLFPACVTKLDLPADAKVEWLIGGDWCGARNSLVQQTLDEGHDWLWYMDDDHAFQPDLLTRLLAWNVPLVNPLCLARLAPFPLVTYETKVGENLYLPINLDNSPEEGLIELEAAGCAGMLIRREVLEAVPPPWFEYTDRSEDIIFCEKAKAAGFQLWGDLGARLGHITEAVVYPDTNEGQWMTRVKIGGGLDIYVSPAHHWTEEKAPEPPPGQDGDVLVMRDSVKTWERPADERAVPMIDLPEARAPRMAERIEIWIDDELRWWWRAIDHDGQIMAKNSGVREEQVIAESTRAYPEATVHQIQREVDDSRNLKQYGPPTRLWNREVT